MNDNSSFQAGQEQVLTTHKSGFFTKIPKKKFAIFLALLLLFALAIVSVLLITSPAFRSIILPHAALPESPGGVSKTVDLVVTKDVSDTQVPVGGQVSFFISVSNESVDFVTATGVVIEDILPQGLDFVSANADRGNYLPSTGKWNVGPVDPIDFLILEITARASVQGAYTNTAQVVAADQADADSTPGNNASGEDDQASTTLRVVTSEVPVGGGSAVNLPPEQGTQTQTVVSKTPTPSPTITSSTSGSTIASSSADPVATVSGTPTPEVLPDSGVGEVLVAGLGIGFLIMVVSVFLLAL